MQSPAHRVIAVVIFCSLLLGIPVGLRAQSRLPDSSSFTLLGAEIIDQDNSTTFQSAQQFGFGTISLNAATLPPGSGGFSMSGTLLGGLNPSVFNTVSESVLSEPGAQSGQSGTSFLYNFEVFGPSTTSVAVDIAANLSDSWTSNVPSGGISDSAQLGIYDSDNNQLAGWMISDQGDASGGESVSVGQSLLLSTNTIYTVFMGTNAGIQLINAGAPIANDTYSTSVSIDPMLSIDPSFQLPGYTLELSPDLQPSSVPETGNTAAMLMLSIAAMVVLCRRRSAPLTC